MGDLFFNRFPFYYCDLHFVCDLKCVCFLYTHYLHVPTWMLLLGASLDYMLNTRPLPRLLVRGLPSHCVVFRAVEKDNLLCSFLGVFPELRVLPALRGHGEGRGLLGHLGLGRLLGLVPLLRVDRLPEDRHLQAQRARRIPLSTSIGWPPFGAQLPEDCPLRLPSVSSSTGPGESRREEKNRTHSATLRARCSSAVFVEVNLDF